MLALVVSLQVKPGHRDGFLAAITADAEASAANEPGCVSFDVVVDTADDHHFFLYEVYRDREALEAHRASPHFAAWTEAAAEHLVPDSRQVTVTERLLHES
ncbi:putative quinol monooxygenase [Saccharopolyspora gregorii]|uniref:ABM domain-containing protein n=1 Tax=Saccharopolyspora gregorii TaxID=33914 RepID=A0ABP6RMJ2_9PSEU|nr:putative quinol monooxygenase [Saccharopolyspora gregorii]